MKIDVSLIYVYYNTPAELEKSINSIPDATEKLKYEIIVVDNASPKSIPKKILNNKKIKVIKNVNSGYGSGLNLGVKHAKGKVYILSNPDVIFKKNSISNLYTKLRDKKIGIAGPQMQDERGNILPTISGKPTIKALIYSTSFFSKFFPRTKPFRDFWLVNKNRNLEQKVWVISGACMAVRREVFEKAGGFDENFFMYFEENDICLKVRKLGYSVVYYPRSKIFHAIGASSKDRIIIEKRYVKSRYYFLKKYNPLYKAFLAELFLRITTLESVALFGVLILSLCLNLYRLNSLMLFIGDSARDFLAARDMLITGKIPLVGIPSSVTWLHQGPLSVYGIALAFWFSGFKPVAPSILFCLIGVVTTFLVYKLSRQYFGRKAAILSSLFYAVSPMVVVNARMPYHTSLIPFFSLIFFLTLLKSLYDKKYIPLVFLAFGFLLQVELSNVVVLAIVVALYLIYKIRFNSRQVALSLGLFLLGILPFLIYDIFYGFAYLKFPLWIVGRLFQFVGLRSSGSSESILIAINTIYQQISGTVFPNIFPFGILIFAVSTVLLLKIFSKIRSKQLMTVLLWIILPLLAFLIHRSPGTAYFALIYPALAIAVGITFSYFASKIKLFYVIFLFIVVSNVFLLVRNEFYVTTFKGSHPMPPTNYIFGTSWKVDDEVANAIVKDANHKEFQLNGEGSIKLFSTGLDTYKFLIFAHNGLLANSSKIVYTIYPKGEKVDKGAIIFRGLGGTVVKTKQI